MANGPTVYYQERLREELGRRIEKNSRFSLRSFAQALRISPSALSLILSGRRPISTRLVDRILAALELTAAEQKQFVESVLEEKRRLGLKRVSPRLSKKLAQLEAPPAAPEAASVGLDAFRVIADWYHYAIFELTGCAGFDRDPKKIAARLGITEAEAKLGVDRLLGLEMLREEGGRLYKTNVKIDTKDKTKTSLFHRRRQKQILEKSMQSLERDPIEVRSHQAVTVGIDPEKIPEAKARIQKFLWELAEFMKEGAPAHVYELNFSMFPLENLPLPKGKPHEEQK